MGSKKHIILAERGSQSEVGIWEEKEVEKHFETRLWYKCHRRLRDYRDEMRLVHETMFNFLISFDDNPPEQFSEGESLSVQEIFEDFEGKYIMGGKDE